jgi:hypothetical protein
VPTVRRLDADDDVVFAAGFGGVDDFAFGTVAFLFRPLAAYDSTNRTLLAAYDSTGAQVGKIALSTANKVQWHSGGSGGNGPTVTAGDWHALIVRKVTGTAQVRFSLLNVVSGWTHAVTAGTFSDWTAPTGGTWSTSDITFGWGPGSDLAAMAVWANELPWAADTFGDAEIVAAGLEDHLNNWRDAAPTAGWAFDQADAAYSIEDFTLNRADELSYNVGTPTDATDLDFQYEDTGIAVTLRNFLRNAQTELGTGGAVYDLSETEGTPTTLSSGNVSAGGFTEVLRWQRTVGDAVGAATISTQLSVATISANAQYRWRVVRLDSSGVEQATSTYSGTQTTTGIKISTFVLSTTWAAGDRLALVLEFGKTSGGGNRAMSVDVNSADSFADFELAVAIPTDVTPADTTHGHTADQPALTQVHTLAPADAAHGHTADQPTVSTVHTLAPDSTSHGHAAGSPALAQAHELAPTAATHSHAAAEPALTQTHEITAADAAHGHAADQAVVVEQGTGLVREFTSAEFVTWAIGTGGLATLLQGAFTVAAICRRIGTPADQGAVLDLAAGLDGSRGFFRYTDADQMDYLRGQFQSPGAGPSWTAADGWVLVAWTKAAGTTAVRYHKGVLAVGADSWTHVDSAGTVDNDDQTCDRAQTRFMEEDGWVFRGRYGVMAAWGSVLSDGALEALTSDYADWQSSAPAALWRFDQAATTTAVDDQAGNGADQTALAGSTVVTDDPIPGFTFGEAAVAVAPADSSHGHTADQPAITQTHELVPADAGHGHTADQPALAQVHQLTPASASHGHTADQPAVDQAHALTPDSGAHGQGVDAAALTQVHQLASGDTTHGHTADQVALTGAGDLLTDNATHGHAADPAALTQDHQLTLAGSAHGHTADAPALAQVHELAPASAVHGQAADQATLASGQTLAADSTTHGHTAAGPALTQTHEVATGGTSHGQVAEPPDLTQVHELTAADAGHGQTADSPTLAGGTTLLPADAAHGHTAGSSALVQVHTVTVAAAVHAHAADQAALTQLHQITAADTAHGHTAGRAELTGQAARGRVTVRSTTGGWSARSTTREVSVR